MCWTQRGGLDTRKGSVSEVFEVQGYLGISLAGTSDKAFEDAFN